MIAENLSTKEKIASNTLGGVADAKNALPGWAATDPEERIAALEPLVQAFNAQAKDMAQAISFEMSAPIALAGTARVGAGAGHLFDTIRY